MDQQKQSSTKNLFKTSVLDKIRSDFNQGKRDRVAAVRLLPVSEDTDESAYTDFFAKLVDSVLAAYGDMVVEVQKDIKFLDSQRSLPGFNFFNFFLLKERLALSFESLTFYEDALVQYDELDAVFTQCADSTLQRNVLPWSENFGARDTMDDSANILSPDKKSYQEAITQNSISIFDFRSYLFARQIRLLTLLNRPMEICYRAKQFMTSMVRSLRRHQDALKPFFVESWIYSACLAVLRHCDDVSIDGSSETARYHSIRGELMHDARKQLDKLGLALGYMPNKPAHLFKATNPTLPELKITNQDLLQALTSLDNFATLYETMTIEARQSFKICGSHRINRLLFGDLADLCFYREKWKEAQAYYENMLNWTVDPTNANAPALSMIYWQSGWTYVEVNALTRLARCFKEMGLKREYLKACWTILIHRNLLEDSSQVAFYMDETLKLDQTLKEQFMCELDAEKIWGMKLAQSAENKSVFHDGRKLAIRFDSRLPLAVKLQSIALIMGNEADQRIQFRQAKTQSLEVQPNGKTSIEVHAQADAPGGTYKPLYIELTLAHAKFVYRFDDFLAPKRLHQLRFGDESLRFTFHSPVSQVVGLSDIDGLRDIGDLAVSPIVHTAHSFSRMSPISPAQSEMVIRVYTRGIQPAPSSYLDLISNTLNFVDFGECPIRTVGSSTDAAVSKPIGYAKLVENRLTVPRKLEQGKIYEILVPVRDNREHPFEFGAERERFELGRVHDVHGVMTVLLESSGQLSYSYTGRVWTSITLVCRQNLVYVKDGVMANLELECTKAEYPMRIYQLELESSEWGLMSEQKNGSVQVPFTLFPGQIWRRTFFLKKKEASERPESPTKKSTTPPGSRLLVKYRPIYLDYILSLRQRIKDLIEKHPSPKELTRFKDFLVLFLSFHSLPNTVARQAAFTQLATLNTWTLTSPPPWMVESMINASTGKHVWRVLEDTIGLISNWWATLEEVLIEHLVLKQPSALHKSDASVIKILVQFVKDFYDKHASIELSDSSRSDPKQQFWDLGFILEVPAPQAIITVEMLKKDGNQIMKLCNPVSFEVRVSVRGEITSTIDFRYILDMDMSTWLLTGQQTGELSLAPRHPKSTISFLLIPLKTGILKLPSVKLSQLENTPESSTSSTQIAAHIVYKHSGKQVSVEPAQQTRSFWINQTSSVPDEPRQRKLSGVERYLNDTKENAMLQPATPMRELASLPAFPISASSPSLPLPTDVQATAKLIMDSEKRHRKLTSLSLFKPPRTPSPAVSARTYDTPKIETRTATPTRMMSPTELTSVNISDKPVNPAPSKTRWTWLSQVTSPVTMMASPISAAGANSATKSSPQ